MCPVRKCRYESSCELVSACARGASLISGRGDRGVLGGGGSSGLSHSPNKLLPAVHGAGPGMRSTAVAVIGTDADHGSRSSAGSMSTSWSSAVISSSSDDSWSLIDSLRADRMVNSILERWLVWLILLSLPPPMRRLLLLLLLLRDAQDGVRKRGKPAGPWRKMFSRAVVDGL